MRVAKFFFLWLVLTVLFCFFNTSFKFYPVLIQALNSGLFTIGFYFSYHVLIKQFFYKGHQVVFGVLYFLVIATLSVISIFGSYQIYVWQKNKFFVDNYWNEPVFFTSNFVLVLLVTSTLLSFQFLRDKMKVQTELENLEKEKLSAELNFLKAQINPHFLFNSLNNILFKIDKSNQEARETLLKFSEMLRYQLYECGSDQVEIEKEVQYIRNYIEIQMMRKNDRYSCELTVTEDVNRFHIAPLLLAPFIENAFKHISNHGSGKNSIRILMDYKDEKFIFYISNDKDSHLVSEFSESNGIGLANVKRRLALLYPQKHELEIINTDISFSVEMKMNVEKWRTGN
ncbi:MAG: sensor histidine kinase [Bacteroidota bacterium]